MDQHVWVHMKNAGARLGFLDRATVSYRTRHASHYRLIGETPPADAIDRGQNLLDHLGIRPQVAPFHPKRPDIDEQSEEGQDRVDVPGPFLKLGSRSGSDSGDGDEHRE